MAVIERFGADALRYYCFRDVSFGQDGSVSTADFETRYETELANELGNLASRTLAMVQRYRAGVVPDVGIDPAVAADFEGLAARVQAQLDRADITGALDEVWQRVRRLNRYVEERAPWRLAREEEGSGELDVTLRSLAEGLRVVAVLLHAYIPHSAGRLLEALGQPELELEAAGFGARGGGARVAALEPLFPKS
jgi:methionyl-tRNA synthetase